MKPIISTFSLMPLVKIPFSQSDIKGKTKTVQLLSEPTYIDHINDNDIECEKRGIMPLKAEKYHEVRLKEEEDKKRRQFFLLKRNKKRKVSVLPFAFFQKKKNSDKALTISSESSLPFNHDSKIKSKFVFRSPNEYINFYKYYLESQASKHISQTESDVQSIAPKQSTIPLYSGKRTIQSNPRSTLFITEQSEDRTRMKTNSISYKGWNSESLKGIEYDTTSTLERDINDISILHFPDETKVNEKTIKKMKRQVKLHKLKNEIEDFVKSINSKEDSDKVRESGLIHTNFIRNNYSLNKKTHVYMKKANNPNIKGKLSEYIQTEPGMRPFSSAFINKIKTRNNKPVTIHKHSSTKYVAPKPIETFKIDEIIIPKPKNHQWMLDNELDFNKEVIEYQNQLGLFFYASNKGVHTNHFASLDNGDKAFHQATIHYN